jgi:hypothetical protein
LPDAIRIDAASLEAARQLADALTKYRASLQGEDGAWVVEVERDREFNELLLGVLEVTDAYLARDPDAVLNLIVDGHTYRLHPRDANAGV